VQSGDSLETLQFGELTIWIEQGPQAVLAGIIRGNAPEELRVIFQETIERIHIHFITALNLFQGDNAPFEASRQYLEDCLQARYKLKRNIFSYFRDINRLDPVCRRVLGICFHPRKTTMEHVFRKLNTQPGIVVITAEKRYGKYFLYGLRDPLAVEPTVLMKQANINPEKVISRWKPYLALDSDCILARARLLLQPPQPYH
jgi:OOP family OmpA-OmpF porin